MRVNPKPGLEVELTTGENLPYSEFQYFKAKRHYKPKELQPMTDIISNFGLSGKSYSTAYQFGRRNNILTLFPRGSRWYEAVQTQPDFQADVQSAFVKGARERA